MFRRRRYNSKRGFGRNFRRRRTFRRFVKRVKKATTAIAEKKYSDFGIATVVSQSGLLIGLTNAIQAGTNLGNRIGVKIRVRYITWRLDLHSDNESSLYYRVCLLRGRTAGLTIADLPSGANAGSTYIDIEKWDVRSDVTFSLGDASTDGRNKKLYTKTHKIFRDITYNDQNQGTGTVNPYYLWVWNNDLIPALQNNVIGTVRTTYVDM